MQQTNVHLLIFALANCWDLQVVRRLSRKKLIIS